MRCDEVANRLNARTDGEISAIDNAALDAHLAECARCREEAESLRATDAELRHAFAPRREAAARLAEKAAAKVREAAIVGPPIVQRSSATEHQHAWMYALAGMAAGFLLAVGLFKPWQRPAVGTDSVTLPAPVARLAVASGPVEVRPVSKLEFFKCPELAPIERESIVRTGPSARCEIELEDGNALRLDCNTEVKLHESEVVEVNRGRLWSCSQPGKKAVEIRSGGGTIVPKSTAQLAVDCQPQAVRLFVLDGEVDVQTGDQTTEVVPGKPKRIINGKVEDDPEWRDALLETAWVNSVLALRGSDHPELMKRVHELLANVGAAKLSMLYEDELRRLGDDGVAPLLAYLNSTRDTPNAAQRTTAARIVADVAESRWITDLIELLTDANADVRFHAARGLERLTGRDQGCEPQTWKTATWRTCEGAHQQWLEWWKENRDRYPDARREIEARTPPLE